jgi:hypothetical protein
VVVGLLAISIVGCGETKDSRPDRPDAAMTNEPGSGGAGAAGSTGGKGASAGNGGSGASNGSGGTAVAGAGGTGGMTGTGGAGGTMPDASISDGSTVHDAASSWDGSHVSFDAGACTDAAADPGDPPPDCIAPCVWELMKNCRLSSCCGRQIEYGVPSAPFPTTDQQCDDQGVLIDSQYPFHASDVYAYRRGVLCYSIHSTYGSNVFLPVKWEGAMGQLIATESPDGTSYDCNGTSYTVDGTQPKCAPWLGATCAPGTCTGTHHVQ